MEMGKSRSGTMRGVVSKNTSGLAYSENQALGGESGADRVLASCGKRENR